MGKGYKQPLRQESRSTWESIRKGTVDYLLSLVTITDGKKKTLSTHKQKTFVLGFVATLSPSSKCQMKCSHSLKIHSSTF